MPLPKRPRRFAACPHGRALLLAPLLRQRAKALHTEKPITRGLTHGTGRPPVPRARMEGTAAAAAGEPTLLPLGPEHFNLTAPRGLDGHRTGQSGRGAGRSGHRAGRSGRGAGRSAWLPPRRTQGHTGTARCPRALWPSSKVTLAKNSSETAWVKPPPHLTRYSLLSVSSSIQVEEGKSATRFRTSPFRL